MKLFATNVSVLFLFIAVILGSFTFIQAHSQNVEYTQKSVTLNGNSQKVFKVQVGGNVISGGVHITDGWDVYTIESFPLNTNTWQFALVNNSNEVRHINLHVVYE